jgi:hypothetical protein
MVSLHSDVQKGGFKPDTCCGDDESHWKVLYVLHGEFRMYKQLECVEPTVNSNKIGRHARNTMLFLGSITGVALSIGLGIRGLPGKLL